MDCKHFFDYLCGVSKIIKMYNMVIERTKSGAHSAYWADGPIHAAGKDFEELKQSMVQALNLGLGRKDISMADVALTWDMQTFFEANPIINAAALSKIIGINTSLLAAYAAGIKRPGPKQVERILQGIHKLGRELAEVQIA